MDENMYKLRCRKKAVRLAALWGGAYLLFGIVDLYLNARSMMYTGTALKLQLGSWSQVIVSFVYLAFFCPLAYYIQRVAKQADMKWLVFLARFMLVLISVPVSILLLVAVFS